MTETDILAIYNEYQVYLMYVNTLSEQISPFRPENNPSFGFFISRNKKKNLMFKDFGTGQFGDIFDFVSLYYKIPRCEAALKIHQDIVDGKSPNKYGALKSTTVSPSNVKITSKTKKFTKDALAYWAKYNISEATLTKYSVMQNAKYWIDNVAFTPKSLSFSYWNMGMCKILNLNVDKKYKWFNNYNYKVLEGFSQVDFNNKSFCFVITKSLKECMFYHELGISAVSAKSETEIIREEYLNHILSYYDKSQIIVLLDNDVTGVKSMLRYETMGFKTLCLKSHKNVTDWYEEDNTCIPDLIKLLEWTVKTDLRIEIEMQESE